MIIRGLGAVSKVRPLDPSWRDYINPILWLLSCQRLYLTSSGIRQRQPYAVDRVQDGALTGEGATGGRRSRVYTTSTS